MRGTTKELAARVAAEQTTAGFTRYSRELREALTTGALAARESGMGVSAFAAATGVSAPSLFGWLRDRQPSFVRVRTASRAPAPAPSPPSSTLTVIDMTSGVHVHAARCTLHEAAALVRALRE